MILAIETSTQVCSVALGQSPEEITEKRIQGKGVHSEYTFTFVRDLLEKYKTGISGLEAILFSNGPGSYTGLRIGAAAIKGLLFRQEVPFYTLPTLFSFAVPFIDSGSVVIHAVIDARRQHLYYQRVEKDSDDALHLSKPAVCEIAGLEKEINKGDVIIGTGWDRMNPAVTGGTASHGTEAISARNLIQGWNHPLVRPHFIKTNVETFEPEYLTMSQVNNTNFG